MSKIPITTHAITAFKTPLNKVSDYPLTEDRGVLDALREYEMTISEAIGE